MSVIKMWKVLITTALLASCCAAEDFISDGTWVVQDVQKCEEPDQYPFRIEVDKRRISRKLDGFNTTLDLPEDLTAHNFGINMEIYKKCEGGYKFSENLGDSSACKMINQFAQSNFEAWMTTAGHDPPNCPIPKGITEVQNFAIDYDQLPKQGKCGEFKTIVYLLKGQEKVGCVTVFSAFLPLNEEDEEDYDE